MQESAASVITFKGPFSFRRGRETVQNIGASIVGVYLWCVETDEATYRIHYVGESSDIKVRLNQHLKKQLSGEYTGFCPKGLTSNVKILMHRANEGMIPRFSERAASEFNEQYIDAMQVFYAALPEAPDRSKRCRYESAIVRAVEDHGQNILHVGHVVGQRERRVPILVDTPNVDIEALTGSRIHVALETG